MHWTSETPPYPGPRPGRRASSATSAHLAGVAAVAVIGAASAAAFMDASPTSWTVADAAERGLLVALCALAGSRTRRWTLLWAGAVALACGGVAGRALGLFVVVGTALLFRFHRRDRVLRAILGASVGLAVLDLQFPTVTGATALLAAAAVTPVLLSGFRHSRRRARRWVLVGGAAVALLVALGVASAALFGVRQRTSVAGAVSLSRQALDSVGSEDPTRVQDRFDRAGTAFEDLSVAADAWWLVPARVVPILGPNVEVVRQAADSGARLSGVAGEVSTSVDQDKLRRPSGGIDLATLASLDTPVNHALDGIRSAEQHLEDADSPWLVPPVQDRLQEFHTELARSRASAEVARLAVERAPALLGADGPRRYLMLLGNPAESRDIGGHLGNWAEIVADQGALHLVEVGMPYDLFSPATAPPPTMTPGAYPQSLVEMRPQYFPQNWGGTPDMGTIARLAAELYPQARPGAPLDGVLYADPAAFAALLEFTGPVPVPGYPVTLTSANAAEFLTKGQFAVLPEGSDALDQVIRSALDAFTSVRLPTPRRLVDVFGPVVRQGRLQFTSLHADDGGLLRRTGLSGEVAPRGEDDVLSVINRNANPNKIDAYLQRDITDDVRWNPVTGQTRSRVTIRLTNALPPGETLPEVVVQTPEGVPVGTNRTQLSVLSPLSAVSAQIDGAPTGIGTQQEYTGVLRHTVLVDVPPGATRVVTLDLDGSVGTGAYTLRWIGQPLVDPGRVHVSVRTTGPDLPGGSERAERDFRADEDRTVRLPGPAL